MDMQYIVGNEQKFAMIELKNLKNLNSTIHKHSKASSKVFYLIMMAHDGMFLKIGTCNFFDI